MKISTSKKLKITFLFSLFFTLFSSGAMAQDAPELIYYKFDDAGSTVTNSAQTPVGDNPASVLGVLSMGGVGQFGKALESTGGTSGANYVNSNWPTNLPNTGFTISMWMNNMPNNYTLYYLFGDNTATSFRAFIGGAAGSGNIILRGTGLPELIIPGISGGPVVVHFVYTGTQILGYKNGVFVASVDNPSTDITGTGPFKIGGYSTSTGMPPGSQIDEFRVYNRALDATEIANTWDKELELPVTPDVPLAPWAVIIGVLLIGLFIVISYRRKVA